MNLDRQLQKTAARHQDVEYEIGALASRHGISVLQARAIISRCGVDLDCIDAEARKVGRTH